MPINTLLLKRQDVAALLSKKPGRISNDEIIVFDSTGTALQDMAAAIIVYEKAVARGIGMQLNFGE